MADANDKVDPKAAAAEAKKVEKKAILEKRVVELRAKEIAVAAKRAAVEEQLKKL